MIYVKRDKSSRAIEGIILQHGYGMEITNRVIDASLKSNLCYTLLQKLLT